MKFSDSLILIGEYKVINYIGKKILTFYLV